MKGKAFLAAALVAALTAPVVFAAPTKGKPPTKGPGCRPNVTVILKGTLTSDPGLGATFFTMNVTGTNAQGKSLKGLGVTITVDAKTKVRRNGAKTIDALALGDSALVQIRRCKADLPLSVATVDDVAAARVVAHPAKS